MLKFSVFQYESNQEVETLDQHCNSVEVWIWVNKFKLNTAQIEVLLVKSKVLHIQPALDGAVADVVTRNVFSSLCCFNSSIHSWKQQL